MTLRPMRSGNAYFAEAKRMERPAKRWHGYRSPARPYGCISLNTRHDMLNAGNASQKESAGVATALPDSLCFRRFPPRLTAQRIEATSVSPNACSDLCTSWGAKLFPIVSTHVTQTCATCRAGAAAHDDATGPATTRRWPRVREKRGKVSVRHHPRGVTPSHNL